MSERPESASSLRQTLAYALKLDPDGDWDEQATLTMGLENLWTHVEKSPAPQDQPGGPRRLVFILTRNRRKLAEYRRHLERHGLEVFQAPPIEVPLWLTALLTRSSDTLQVLAVVREATDLFRFRTAERCSLQHLERVHCVSVLKVYRLVQGQLAVDQYRQATEGYIDLSRRTGKPTVFGWDDVFVVKNVGLTYHELRKRDLRVTARDLVIGEFLHQHVCDRAGVGLRFDPQGPRPIDFSNPVGTFVAESPHLNNAVARANGLAHLFTAAANEGAFFRASDGRRENPSGLTTPNAGIWFVPRQDPIQENVPLARDLLRHLLPDLLFTGTGGPALRDIYLAHRLTREAMTLVLCEMALVDTLRRAGQGKDWKRRPAYTLFNDLEIHLADPSLFLPNLEKLLQAGVYLGVRGDDSGFRSILQSLGKPADLLERFLDRYAPAFAEEYRRAARVWNNLENQADFYRRWWEAVRPLRDAGQLNLQTVEEFSAGLGLGGDIVDRVARHLFETCLRPLLERPAVQPAGPETQLGRAFFRWMMGQAGLFVWFDPVPESRVYLENLRQFLITTGPYLDLGTIDRLRRYVDQFVDLLLERNLISPGDSQAYREVFPLYPPTGFLPDEAGPRPDLASLARRLLLRQEAGT